MRIKLGFYVGWVVKIKTTQQMAVVISDNCVKEKPPSKWAAVVRTLDGQDAKFHHEKLDFLPADPEASIFSDAAHAKYPDLLILGVNGMDLDRVVGVKIRLISNRTKH